jgi:hypothetical protein
LSDFASGNAFTACVGISIGGSDAVANSFIDVVRVETCFKGADCASARLGGMICTEACFDDAAGARTRLGGTDSTCA